MFDGAESMFRLPNEDDKSDIDRIHDAELHVTRDIERAKKQVDSAREELKREWGRGVVLISNDGATDL